MTTKKEKAPSHLYSLEPVLIDVPYDPGVPVLRRPSPSPWLYLYLLWTGQPFDRQPSPSPRSTGLPTSLKVLQGRIRVGTSPRNTLTLTLVSIVLRGSTLLLPHSRIKPRPTSNLRGPSSVDLPRPTVTSPDQESLFKIGDLRRPHSFSLGFTSCVSILGPPVDGVGNVESNSHIEMSPEPTCDVICGEREETMTRHKKKWVYLRVKVWKGERWGKRPWREKGL